MKHAFLIIAHNEWKILRTLIHLLDHEKIDIYIHIDKKSEVPSDLNTQHSNLYILDKRYDVRWGDLSQIQTEMSLFKYASQKSTYIYYHLLSGVDLPIKPIEYILSFFEENFMNGKKEFVGFVSNNDWRSKVEKYHFFTKHYKTVGLKKNIYKILRYFSEKMVNFLLTRDNNLDFKKGCNWVSITDNFCRYLVNKEEFILNRFKYTYCADEIFLQTIIWNSPFKENIYSIEDEYDSCMREIDWNRGNPYIWGQDNNDFEKLKNSKKIFARKFSIKYPNIISSISNLVKGI